MPVEQTTRIFSIVNFVSWQKRISLKLAYKLFESQDLEFRTLLALSFIYLLCI